jgi:hypothetical protein
MRDVIAWLESPEGEEWSRKEHVKPDNNHAHLVAVKTDARDLHVNERMVGILFSTYHSQDLIKAFAHQPWKELK